MGKNPQVNGVYDLYDYFDKNKIISECNSPEEIADLADEMYDLINGGIKYDDEIEEMRECYREIVRKYYKKGTFNVMGGNIGAKWLLDNKWFLAK